MTDCLFYLFKPLFAFCFGTGDHNSKHFPVKRSHTTQSKNTVLPDSFQRIAKAIFFTLCTGIGCVEHEGGLFAPCDSPLPAGERVRVVLHHPRDGSVLALEGTVLRTVGGGEPGIGVTFTDPGPDGIDVLMSFVEAAESPDSLDEALIIDGEDDQLA